MAAPARTLRHTTHSFESMGYFYASTCRSYTASRPALGRVDMKYPHGSCDGHRGCMHVRVGKVLSILAVGCYTEWAGR